MKHVKITVLSLLLLLSAISEACKDKLEKEPGLPKLNLKFEDSISEEVLKNYLSRSLTYSFMSMAYGSAPADLSVITSTGAKYISRAIIPWEAETNFPTAMGKYKEVISNVHDKDPDVIVEACIFETVFPSCEQTAIPGWVFQAFDKPAENRNFSYAAMLFPDNRYRNHWGNNGSVPDITQLETQMYFYYRACEYVKAGFEGIHWGQVELMGETDAKYQSFFKLLAKVRKYASINARRKLVLNNAHTHGIADDSGNLLFDFHTYPIRPKAPKGSVAHAPSESNPQETILEINHLNSIYKRSLGGKTYSGWECTSLPYFVELDNYGAPPLETLHNPNVDYWAWGMDEISWFGNQPKHYRDSWLRYAYNWVRINDSQGFLCMTGSRPMYYANGNKMGWYFCQDPKFHDLNVIKDIWMKAK